VLKKKVVQSNPFVLDQLGLGLVFFFFVFLF